MRSVWIAIGLAAVTALPVSAQRAATEIALVEGAAPAGAIVLGEVRAEIHQGSLIARTPARDLADRELRAQAAKLGADAVVDVRYENNSPLFSKRGFRAVGKAVKFAPAQVAAAPAFSAPPIVAVQSGDPSERVAVTADDIRQTPFPIAPEPGRGTVFVPAEPAQHATPVLKPLEPAAAQTPPTAPASVALAPPAPPAPPVAQPAPVAAANPPAPRGPTPEALIVLTEDDLAGRAYDRLGEVSASARQTSLFPKKTARAMMDEQLRSKAAALGADAVILIRYEASSPLLSRKGFSATGFAVKYR
jgi:uncharacterized protein YbjQ (UPF0145 family)